MKRNLSLLLAACVGGALTAQSNAIPGRDIRLLDTHGINDYRHTGTFPNGAIAIGVWTTCCNPGTSRIPFIAAMDPNHGFIHYIVARESNGRLVQISNRAYVKHTFGSNNDPSTCGSCAGPGDVNYVEVGCADTYANSQAVQHYNLGPPDEVDPWLGTWVPACSHFDRGEPEGPPSTLCDGARSLTSTQAAVLDQGINHATRVADAELNVAGAAFYWQAGYLVGHEPEATRGDNIGSRRFNAAWSGTSWNFTDSGAQLQGTILQRWSGATVSSNTNGGDDGRCYVAVKVTGPVNGLYHYEYAVHNRDNSRGIGAFRIPTCPEAVVTNYGFHDVDTDGTNDWTASHTGAEIVFQTSTNPLKWNSFYNVWFDTDAAPLPGSLTLDQYAPGTGAPSFPVATTTPSGVYNQNLGPGCGTPVVPSLWATGSPARASIPNASFALRATNVPAGLACGFVLSTADGTTSLGSGCTLYSAGLTALLGPLMTFADASGAATMPLAVPATPALEGTHLDFQAAAFVPGGTYLGNFNLSNGLRIRIGSLIAGCP